MMNNNYVRNKGGRPKKDMPRNQQLAVMCTILEKQEIERKAKIIQKSVSEFLRLLGMNSQIDIKQKVLPKEVLQLTGTLNHLAANINSLAHKNNRMENFNAIERAELKYLASQVQQLAKDIKSYLQ